MKITQKFITQNGKFLEKDLKSLNLSRCKIAIIENLDECVNLKHLHLSHNELYSLQGLEKCRQLWHLDVKNNKIKNLDGLNKFVAFGTLNLQSNVLSWAELEKIRHLHILDLTISNNSFLEKDNYSRIHLIDCLPNVWMIDGLLVTTSERLAVSNFFSKSALTSKPVRRKLPAYQFVPSDLKKRDVFGDWSVSLLSKFPVNGVKNIETDTRRVEFLASWFEEIIREEEYTQKTQMSFVQNSSHVDLGLKRQFLKDLLDYRRTHTEMCNMILVLLVAHLKFNLPIEFMRETLEYANLSKINDLFETFRLFALSRKSRIYVSNLLLSAAKIDRDQNIEAGFYENLFLSLRNILKDLMDTSQPKPVKASTRDGFFDSNTENSDNDLINHKNKENSLLLSTEVIQLFCIVPSFYDYLSTSQELNEILEMSLGPPHFYQAVVNFMNDLRHQNKTQLQVCEEAGSFITNLIKLNARQLISNKLGQKKRVKKVSNFYQSQPQSATDTTVIQINTLKPKSAVNPSGNKATPSQRSSTMRSYENDFYERNNNNSPEMFTHNHSNETSRKLPEIGERVVLEPAKMGQIIAIENSTFLVIQFEKTNESELSTSNEIENIAFMDTKYLIWNSKKKCWHQPHFLEENENHENRGENNFMPALSPSSDNSNSESKKISFQSEPNVINADVGLLDLHEVVEVVEPKSHFEKPNSQLSVRINSSLDNKTSRSNHDKTSNTVMPISSKIVNISLNELSNGNNGSFMPRTYASSGIQPILFNAPLSPLSTSRKPENTTNAMSTLNSTRQTSKQKSRVGNKTVHKPIIKNAQKESDSVYVKQEERASSVMSNELQNSECVQKWVDFISTNKHENTKCTHDDSLFDIIDPLNESETKSTSTHLNDFRTSKCAHCQLEFKKSLPLQLNEVNEMLNEQPQQQAAVRNVVTPTSPKQNQAVNQFFMNMNQPNYKMIQSAQSTSAKKQLIKLKDCTSWLTPSNKTDNNTPSAKMHTPNGLTNKTIRFLDQQNMSQFYSYKNGMNHINMLLNRKQSRINTDPKVPLLISPSSRKHMMYKGLRPNSINYGTDINLISRKLDINRLSTVK